MLFLRITVFVVLGHQRHDLVIATAIGFLGLKVINVFMTQGGLRKIFLHIVSGFYCINSTSFVLILNKFLIKVLLKVTVLI